MRDTKQTGSSASSYMTSEWHQIDWKTVHRNVRSMQIRITKAVQESKWRKVKALQRMLTRSFSAKAMAVKRVTDNRGKRTPGVDNTLWKTPRQKWEAIATLNRQGYQPKPLRRIYIPKPNGKKRPLGIPTMKDRAMQALHLYALDPVSETLADVNSYGFRPHRSTADAIAQCFTVLSNRSSAEWILEADIKGCFDNINHKWLIEHAPIDKVILKKWLTSGFMESKRLFPTTAGTPQGGIISPTLANMTLDGLENVLKAGFKPTNSADRPKVNMVRYADDFIITCNSKELLANEVKPMVITFLKERGLTLSDEKTAITHIENGFDFLGQNVRKYNGKLLIKPARKNVARFLRKVKKTIRSMAAMKQEVLIKQLNPLIRGWANYHHHIVAKEIYNRIDWIIWRMLYQWSKRRHPKKSRQWVMKKYFKPINGVAGRFACVTTTGKLLTLVKASETVIKRHIKIRGDANPYALEDELYFEGRIDRTMREHLSGRKKLLAIWLNQNGLCPVCDQRIIKGMEWDVHHIIPKVAGGSEQLSNLVMLHSNCHRQVHCRNLTVTAG